MDLLEDLAEFEREQHRQAIIDAMSSGLSEAALPGLLNMTTQKFHEYVRNNEVIRQAIDLGEAKSVLFYERLALSAARDKSNVLLALLKERMGLDSADRSGGTLVVEVKKFVDGSKPDHTSE